MYFQEAVAAADGGMRKAEGSKGARFRCLETAYVGHIVRDLIFSDELLGMWYGDRR